MYEQFYGLRERPFDLTPNPRYLVPTEIHREALSNLEYAIAGRKGVTLLVGDAGAGKTTVIRAAIARQSDLTHCVHLHNPTLTRLEFMEMLAARFGLSDRALASKTALLLELEQLLRRRRDAREGSVLIVDEAHSLPFELLEEVRLLANIETDSEKLLSLVIAGQPEIAEHLNHPSLRQLKQRIELRCELRPLQRLETFTYLQSRIRAAGGVATQSFTRDAVEVIHDRSRGNPRTINVIADNSLIAGLALQQRPVRAGTVVEVCQEFDVHQDDGAHPADVSVSTHRRTSSQSGKESASNRAREDQPSAVRSGNANVPARAATGTFGWKTIWRP
jgi:type II secretory pathway predicted ATPase ExeA